MWYENLDGSTRVMIFIPIESSDMNKIFQLRHHNIEHDLKKKSKTSFINFQPKTSFYEFSRVKPVLGSLIILFLCKIYLVL
jgi:hypothetical protein